MKKKLFFIKWLMRERKMVSIIIALLVTISSALFFIGISNLVNSETLLTDAYKKSSQPEILLAYQAADYDKNLKKDIQKNKEISKIQENTYYASTYKSGGEARETIFLMDSAVPHSSDRKLIGENNKLKDNEIVLPQIMKEQYNLSNGDEVAIYIGETKYKFKIYGFFDDPVFSSPFLGVKRSVVSSAKYKEISKNSQVTKYMVLEGFLKHVSDISASSQAVLNRLSATKIDAALNFSYSEIESTALMASNVFNIILISIAFIVSLCILIILRFTLKISIQKDSKNIGILMALGNRKKSTAKIYFFKYDLLIIVGLVIGSILGYFLLPLINGILYLMSGLQINGSSITSINIGFILCFFVLTSIIIMFSCARILKLDPIEAMNGDLQINSEKRLMHQRPKLQQLKGLSLNLKMSFIQMANKFSQAVLLLLVTTVFSLVILITLGLLNIFNSVDSTMTLLGAKNEDIYMLAPSAIENKSERMNKLEKQIEDDTDLTYSAWYGDQTGKIKDESIAIQVYSKFNPRNSLVKGKMPKSKTEIMMSYGLSQKLNLSIGDKIKITKNSNNEEYKISGIYQSIDNNGNNIRMSGKSYKIINPGYSSSMLVFNLGDNSSQNIEKIVKDYNKKDKLNIGNIRGSYISSMSLIQTGILMLLTIISITTVLLILIVSTQLVALAVEMEKIDFLTLSTLGFSKKRLKKILIYRFTYISLFGSLVGGILMKLFAGKFLSAAMKGIGIAKIEMSMELVQFIGVILLILLCTLFGSYLASRKLKTTLD